MREKVERAGGRKGEGQDQRQKSTGRLLGQLLGTGDTQWASYQAARGAPLAGCSQAGPGPEGMRLVGAPAG